MVRPLTEIPPETNAPDILDESVAWCVAQPYPGQEKEVARGLLPIPGIVYFLPYAIHRTKNRNAVHKPLFAGYIFVGQTERAGVYIPSQDYLAPKEAVRAIFDTRKCQRSILPITDQTRFRSELATLQKTRPEAVVPLPKTGDPVKIQPPHALAG